MERQLPLFQRRQHFRKGRHWRLHLCNAHFRDKTVMKSASGASKCRSADLVRAAPDVRSWEHIELRRSATRAHSAGGGLEIHLRAARAEMSGCGRLCAALG
eukprot:scaffold7356_cov249-Pinguiococcus_pyrenoidosus.AAC.3